MLGLMVAVAVVGLILGTVSRAWRQVEQERAIAREQVLMASALISRLQKTYRYAGKLQRQVAARPGLEARVQALNTENEGLRREIEELRKAREDAESGR